MNATSCLRPRRRTAVARGDHDFIQAVMSGMRQAEIVAKLVGQHTRLKKGG